MLARLPGHNPIRDQELKGQTIRTLFYVADREK